MDEAVERKIAALKSQATERLDERLEEQMGAEGFFEDVDITGDPAPAPEGEAPEAAAGGEVLPAPAPPAPAAVDPKTAANMTAAPLKSKQRMRKLFVTMKLTKSSGEGEVEVPTPQREQDGDMSSFAPPPVEADVVDFVRACRRAPHVNLSSGAVQKDSIIWKPCYFRCFDRSSKMQRDHFNIDVVGTEAGVVADPVSHGASVLVWLLAVTMPQNVGDGGEHLEARHEVHPQAKMAMLKDADVGELTEEELLDHLKWRLPESGPSAVLNRPSQGSLGNEATMISVMGRKAARLVATIARPRDRMVVERMMAARERCPAPDDE